MGRTACLSVISSKRVKDCLKYGLKVYAVPIELGMERERESTWFKGYTDKFFIDRGVLYHFLYGRLAYLMSVRFIVAHGKVMCREIPPKNALALMKKGINIFVSKGFVGTRILNMAGGMSRCQC